MSPFRGGTLVSGMNYSKPVHSGCASSAVFPMTRHARFHVAASHRPNDLFWVPAPDEGFLPEPVVSLDVRQGVLIQLRHGSGRIAGMAVLTHMGDRALGAIYPGCVLRSEVERPAGMRVLPVLHDLGGVRAQVI